jgi:hypothetical protein
MRPRSFDGLAQRQECRDWLIPAELAAEEFGCEQGLGEEASEDNAGRVEQL